MKTRPITSIGMILAFGLLAGCESSDPAVSEAYGDDIYADVAVPTQEAAADAAEQEITAQNFDEEFDALSREIEDDEAAGDG